ncbi:MAG: hypothetical protein AB7F43_12220 [Bacteriovoracia bacterium]
MATASKLFIPDLFPESKVDPEYKKTRDLSFELVQERRDWLEAAWIDYQHLCPEDPLEFIRGAQIDFGSAVWQMLLTVLLKRKGFDLVRPQQTGPDIILNLNG